tara:strand:+ start:1570 stop:2502 length:933 start_codon:yes stop_codon:yes gene_type:complete
MKKKLIKIFSIVLLFFLLTNYAKTENEITIKFQIENEILTNIDFLNEEKYLLALNNNLQNIPKNQLKQLAKESLVREKIKKIELSKYYDFNIESKYSEKILKDFYGRLNFKDEKQFKLYLKEHNLNLIDIKEKLKIEALWNELIFKKFNNQVNVNEEQLRKKLSLQKNLMIEYNLSEILFEIKSKEKIDSKYKLILKNIKDSGFKNAANIFSISDSSKFGGDLGWISETQLNENLLNQIKLLNIKQLTKPIQVTNGYLIIRLNDKREKKLKIDSDKVFKKMILDEKNRQFNQFSLIYFNKIKQNISISEK